MTGAPQAISHEPEQGAAALNTVPRAASVIFLVVVALCLLVPLAQTVVPIFGKIVPPLEERRRPNPFPAPNSLWQTNGAFAAGLNKWFDDRVGFRDLFIRSKNQIDYSVFGTSKKVYVGKHGWLFDQGDMDPLARLNAADMTALEGRFVTLSKLLADRGIRLIVIAYPPKVRIYPEMASADTPIPPPDGNHQKLREFLAHQSTLTFIDVEAILKREKLITKEHLYSKLDLHATQAGQLPVVKEIIAQVARLEGRPDIHWDEPLKPSHFAVDDGSESRALSTLIPLHEADIPSFKGTHTIGDDDPDGAWSLPGSFSPDRSDEGLGRPYDFEFRRRSDLCPQRFPGAMLWGNSFSDAYFALGLQHYFCFIRRARDPMSRFKLFYDTMPKDTKYFIFEYYDVWLPAQAPPVELIEPHG